MSHFFRQRTAIQYCAVLLALLFFRPPAWSKPQPLTDFVDPFIGVDRGGSVFPGPSLPFGLVKLSPDTTNGTNSGYSSDGDIVGFSHLHVSGTGGAPKYGLILLQPTTGPLQISDTASPRADETARVGSYGATLTRYNVRAEISASERVGFHQYTFPATKDAHILIDIAHTLGTHQPFLSGEAKVVSPTLVEGYGRYKGGWNIGGEYRVYFSARFDTPAISWGTWQDKQIFAGKAMQDATAQPLGAFLNYHTTARQNINVKVGISFLSTQQARRNADREIPYWRIGDVEARATRIWNQKLNSIQIEGGTPAQRTLFYTALYRSMLMPSDRSAENPLWQSSEPYYDDYYAIWDTFRTLNPLLTLIAPQREVDIVRSLVDIYRHEGYMPDARSGNWSGVTQGGSNADILVADAFVKGLKGVDYPTAFQAMLKDAEVPPANHIKEGRYGLNDYNAKGYVAQSDQKVSLGNSASRTMEYANDDWAIAQVARGLGHEAEYQKYRARASNWENLWDDTVSAEGANGFIRPRDVNGDWLSPFTTLGSPTKDPTFYEGTSWTYSFYVPQDVRRLVQKSGGPEAFKERLNTYFNHGYFDPTNEPAFLVPYLYHWIGRPDLSVDRVHQLLQTQYRATRDGWPGNDDAGAMSSLYIFDAMGFFPNAGQDIYLIGSPIFRRVTLQLGDNKQFVIEANNLSEANRYVQSATLNGHPLDRAWFRHGEIKNGARLVLNLGPKPSNWGTQNPPPSLSDKS